MAHSIELLLDDDTDAAIRATWRLLDEAGLPSQVRVKSTTNRPHVTLIAAQRIDPEVDGVLGGVAGRFPLACVVGAPLVFGAARHTLARLIVPSAELLALHEQVYRLSLPFLTGDPFAHCQPGHWTPHATLGRRFGAEEIGAAMAVLNGSDDALAGRVTGLRRWDSDERVDRVLV